ncbi:MAG: class I SAM-dependent methyltransferase [Calditrichia bacterium]
MPLQQLENQLKQAGARREKRLWFYDRIIPTSFEEAYIALRKKEGRFYSDAQLYALPLVSENHPLTQEWTIRAQSLERMQRYLSDLKSPPRLLDIGCGNGWMTRHLHPYSQLTVGLDMNSEELLQAARVFHEYGDKLLWLYGSIFDNVLPEKCFDIILLGSSIQYFPNVTTLLNRLQYFLAEGGEVHIIDSPFYAREGIEAAKTRSNSYYQSAGFPALSSHFFHHAYEELAAFKPKTLYDPRSFRIRLGQKLKGTPKSPFPWLCIKR